MTPSKYNNEPPDSAIDLHRGPRALLASISFRAAVALRFRYPFHPLSHIRFVYRCNIDRKFIRPYGPRGTECPHRIDVSDGMSRLNEFKNRLLCLSFELKEPIVITQMRPCLEH